MFKKPGGAFKFTFAGSALRQALTDGIDVGGLTVTTWQEAYEAKFDIRWALFEGSSVQMKNSRTKKPAFFACRTNSTFSEVVFPLIFLTRLWSLAR